MQGGAAHAVRTLLFRSRVFGRGDDA